MALDRPSLTQIVNRGKDDLDGSLPGADSRLRHSVLGVLATAGSGAIHGLYGAIDYVARQILPDTQDDEWLLRQANIYGVYRKPATLAAGQVTATGVDGSVIQKDAVLQRAGGREYRVQADVTVAGGVANVSVAATQPGVAGVAEAGVKLAFVSPIAGVGANVEVAEGGLTGGADVEPIELLRERLLERLRTPPQGGSPSDYIRWAKEVPEVTRAWVYPGWTGSGNVGVAFMMDGRVDPLPTSDDVDAVSAYLDEVAPVGGLKIVFAPIPAPLNLTINDLQPNDSATRAAIEAELRDLLFRSGQPGGTIPLTHIQEAISTAAGEKDHVLASPVANFVASPGHLPVLGVITWGP